MVSRERKREMYRRKSKGWYKHKDFILLDLFCMFLAFLIAYINKKRRPVQFYWEQAISECTGLCHTRRYFFHYIF